VTRDAHIEHRLQAYLDGELSEANVAAVEAHVAECASCRAALDELRELQALLVSDAAPELGESLWPRIAEQIAPKKPWWSTAFGLGTAGAAVAGIVIGVMLGLGSPTSSTPASVDENLWSAIGASVVADNSYQLIDFPADETSDEATP